VPSQIYLPINLESIDANALLNHLIKVFCTQFKVNFTTNKEGLVLSTQDDNIEQIAKNNLMKQLNVMEQTGDSYRTGAEFRTALQTRFQALAILNSYDFGSIDLDSLQIPLKSVSFLSKLD